MNPDHDRAPVLRDLSRAFGTAAVAALGGVGPARVRTRGKAGGRSRDAGRARAGAPEQGRVPGPPPRGRGAAPDAPVPRRPPSTVHVRDRAYLDLLLLAAVRTGPASGYAVVDLVRAHSQGVLVLSARAVHRELRRLTKERVVHRAGEGGAGRFVLTALGERVLRTRRREWEAVARGLDSVLEASGDGH